MGKIEMKKKAKSKKYSVKWCFFLYLPICVAVAVIGAYGIGVATNYLQNWYENQYLEENLEQSTYEIIIDENGVPYYSFVKDYDTPSWLEDPVWGIISYAQFILIPVWVFVCVGVTGVIFYQKELKKPITILLDASQKISENCLDFQIDQSTKQNELGELCLYEYK